MFFKSSVWPSSSCRQQSRALFTHLNISYLSASICFICFPVLLLCGLQYCFLTAWGGLKAFLIHILVHSCKYYTELPMELRTKRKRKCKAAHFPLIMHYANVIRFFPFCRDLLLLLECRQQVTFLESSRFVNFRWIHRDEYCTLCDAMTLFESQSKCRIRIFEFWLFCQFLYD